MIAKVVRFYDYEGSKNWNVAVYWTHDHEKFPQDYDLWLSPADWRKFSGCRSPKKGETMTVEITVEIDKWKKPRRKSR
jgi:hypothetical protein